MKRMALIGVCAAVAALAFTGCNWTSSSDSDSWSSSHNWVNFSGTYRNAEGPFLVTAGNTSSRAADDQRGGASGASVYSFVLQHQGQHLTIVDSNGAVYTGLIRILRSTSGTEYGDDPDRHLPRDGDAIVASFDCSGYSRAGYSVQIVGTLQGSVSLNVFGSRTIHGTWVERGGRTGDIRGSAAGLPITPDTDLDDDEL